MPKVALLECLQEEDEARLHLRVSMVPLAKCRVAHHRQVAPRDTTCRRRCKVVLHRQAILPATCNEAHQGKCQEALLRQVLCLGALLHQGPCQALPLLVTSPK